MGRPRKQHSSKELAELVGCVSSRLKLFREQANLSQSELARQAGVSKSTVNEIENEEATDLQFSTVVQLAKVLNRTPIEFLVSSPMALPKTDAQDFKKACVDLEGVFRAFDRIKKNMG